MATRFGHQMAQELVDKYGWQWAPVLHAPGSPEDEVYGDRWVIDPLTGREMSPAEGCLVQNMRTLASHITAARAATEGDPK